MKFASALLFCFAAITASANEQPPVAFKPDLAKGAATAAVCSACHSSDGSRGSPAQPILQGQHPEYLVKQLTEFKSGLRANAIMNGLAATLSEEDMKNVAAFYASKQAKPGFAKDAELAKLGEKVYRGGVAERSIPACAACHGPNGAGIPVQYPRMAGQHADYTAAQLTAFRGGVRKNNAQMMGVAAKLNDREIQGLAEYIAGLH
ncbi:MAG: c-type cytochrome [Burkholderiales bacterium]